MRPNDDNVVSLPASARRAAESFGQQHDRQLLTILFTDLVDSTKIQSELGNAEAARLTELHRKIVREELKNYDAREIEWAGDSCLAVFTKPSDAVAFALRMQAEHRRIRESEPRLPHVRTGIHMGEVLVKRAEGDASGKEDLFGLQVSETARIMSLARPNQILCSPAVFENARNALRGDALQGLGPVVWLEHGHYELAGVEKPVEICEVGENEFAPLKPPPDSEKCRRTLPATAPGATAPASGKPWGVALAVLTVAIIALGLYAATVVNRNRGAALPDEDIPSDFSVSEPGPEAPKPVQRILMSLRPEHPLIAPEFGNAPLTISPDGSSLVYIADIDGAHMLVYRPMSELESRILPGTEDATNPIFSPDGKWVAYMANGKLMKVSIAGGPPIELADCNFPTRGDWTRDDEILFTPAAGAGLHRVSAHGGEPTQAIESPDFEVQVTPSGLPENKGILYSLGAGPRLRTSSVKLHPADGGPDKDIADSAAYARYLPTGHIVYAQEGRLTALPFDLDTLEPTGTPQTVPEEYIAEADTAPTYFDVSDDGTLVYIPGGAPSENQASRELVWVDRDGTEEIIAAPPNNMYYYSRVSPDGRYIASAIIGLTSGSDIWLYELERGALSKVSSSPRGDTSPGWLPDGRIVFSSNRAGAVYDLYAVTPNTSDAPVRLTESDRSLFAPTAGPDGRTLFVSAQYSDTGFDVAVVPLDGSQEARIIVQTSYNEGNPVLSPDGRCLAYSTVETGRPDVYVVSYPELDRKILVSPEGGREPCWAPYGSELYYRDGDKMMAVQIETEPELQVGKPELLFEKPFFTDPLLSRGYDVSPVDGRFLMMRGVQHSANNTLNQIVVVTNWFEELKRLAPGPEAER